MRLRAISAGTGVPSDRFTGVVHSVFRRACNIRTDDRGLLALLAPELGNVPHGVRVEAPAGLAFADHIRAGQRVGCRAAVLRIADSDLAVDLRTALIWRSELAGLRVDLTRPTVASAWQVAWRASQRRRRSAHDPLLGTVYGRGVALADASRALDLDRAIAAVRALIGCGPGLTPAGDDLIVGLLAGLFASLGDDPARRRFLHALGVIITVAAAATGEISRTYLRHATLGRVAEPLARLAGAIGAGLPAAEVERAADQALKVGHTSGGDGVFGLLLGLLSWSRGEPGHG
jgi:Protein of unknown function (DUF2877)